MVLLQMALFVIVSAVIMSSSLCLGAAGRDNIAGQTVLNSKLAAIAFFLFVIIYEIE